MTRRATMLLALLATMAGACAPTWTPGTPIPPGYKVEQDAFGQHRMYSPFRQCARPGPIVASPLFALVLVATCAAAHPEHVPEALPAARSGSPPTAPDSRYSSGLRSGG